MDIEDRAAKRAKAFADQLNAEIAASQYKNLKALTTAQGWSYGTYLRYTTGERLPQMSVVYDILDAIGVAPDVFFRRVEDRFAN